VSNRFLGIFPASSSQIVVSRLGTRDVLSERLVLPRSPSRLPPGSPHYFRLCVPDEWYRRSASKSRALSSSTLDDGDTLRRRAAEDLDEGDEEDEDGTAKAAKKANQDIDPAVCPSLPNNGEASKNRLSSIFENWVSPTSNSPTSSTPQDWRKSVSDPIRVEGGGTLRLKSHATGSSASNISDDQDESDTDVDAAEFDHMLDEVGLKGPKREAMYNLPADRKKYLLRQHQQSRATSAVPSSSSNSPSRATSGISQTFGPASASQLLPRLVPQLTGDSIMKRFSIAGWGAAATPPTSTSEQQDTMTKEEAEPAQLVPQTTGGLWGGWWASSGGTKESPKGGKKKSDSPEAYVEGIQNGYVC